MTENKKKIDYVGKMILAPMVKIGTLPTRLLAIDYGADLVYTEEIIDWRLLRSKRIENDQLETVDYIDKSDDTLVLRIGESLYKVISRNFCPDYEFFQLLRKNEVNSFYKSEPMIQTELFELPRWLNKILMQLT